ncbi:MAG: hypothetical protein HY308_17045 [Gammaproteobacteria bacterium]|nr:hypothetical protein [Gammaproteobacteria bacterium]
MRRLLCLVVLLATPLTLYATSGSPSASYYPVLGPHQHGWGVSGPFTCNNEGSDSDFRAGSHLGNDIMAAKGTPVIATTAGVVQGSG